METNNTTTEQPKEYYKKEQDGRWYKVCEDKSRIYIGHTTEDGYMDFTRNLPEEECIRCIESWKHYFPGAETFDVAPTFPALPERFMNAEITIFCHLQIRERENMRIMDGHKVEQIIKEALEKGEYHVDLKPYFRD